jgi:hypothetical protein
MNVNVSNLAMSDNPAAGPARVVAAVISGVIGIIIVPPRGAAPGL